MIRRLGSTPATKVGRNQPCPCGSGRKYKVCHLREEVHPLPDRVALVYARLLAWAARWVVDEAPPGVTSPDPMLMLDLAIFEGGLAEEYLQRRGPLLREDERALIERWLSSRPQPYEVSDAKAGTWITLKPLLDGDPVTLHDRLLSQTARPGDVMVARIVDSGDGPTVATNPHAVPPLRRPELIDLFDEFTPGALLTFFDQAPTPYSRTATATTWCSARSRSRCRPPARPLRGDGSRPRSPTRMDPTPSCGGGTWARRPSISAQ